MTRREPLNRQREEFKELLDSMDFVILRNSLLFMKEVNPELLKNYGFELSSTIRFQQPGRKSKEVYVYKRMTELSLMEEDGGL